ncbi:hypothetical protein ACN47E_006713 [Coniothyrium glycines]
MPEQTLYNQRLLSGRKIRLLSLCPADNVEVPLQCECHVFDLDNAPPFESLSYVWGTQESTVIISCNGAPLRVRSALANALSRLRLHESPRIIWADAICINQIDQEEKSHQVPQMRDIYRLAERVVVWLGLDELQQASIAADCVSRIASACRDYERQHEDPDGYDKFTKVIVPIKIFSKLVCDSLQALYGRPWFSRVWCIQEVRLARNATILWGEQEMTWSDVGMAATWIFYKGTELDYHVEAVVYPLDDVDVHCASIMYRDMAAPSLLDVLRSYRYFEATDPRDKVYGLLGLVKSKTEVAAMRVDYNKSVGEVYTDTVLATIRTLSRLAILAYVSHSEDFDGYDTMPSFVPRWDDTANMISIPDLVKGGPWSASANKMANLGYSNRPNQVLLTGLKFDTVVELQAIMRFDADSPLEQTHPFLLAFDDLSRAANSSSEIHLRKLARTLTVGTVVVDHIIRWVDELDVSSQAMFYDAFWTLINTLRNRHEALPEHDATSRLYETQAHLYCDKRRIFRTRNGSFGLGPQCMRTGDMVVVLYGGNTPYVLRPRGDKFLFMGQAYVDEIMKGELLKGLDNGSIQEQQFCLF